MKEDNDNEDSEVNYEDPEEDKENQPPHPPPGVTKRRVNSYYTVMTHVSK